MAEKNKPNENIAESVTTPVEEKKQASYRFVEKTNRKESREKKKALEEKYAVKKITPTRVAIIILVCLIAVGIITAGVCIGSTGVLLSGKVNRENAVNDNGGGDNGGGGSEHGNDITHEVAYTVSFTSGGGVGNAPASFTKYKNEKFRLPLCSFTYEGHEFKCWEYDGKSYKANAEFTMPGKNVAFKALWDDASFLFELSEDGNEYYIKGIGNCTADDVVLPSTYLDLPVVKILDGAFKDCEFKSISIPASINEIGNNAFSDCINLGKIEIPSSVRSVGDYAFCGCSKLGEVIVTDNLLYIGHSAFHETKWYSDQSEGQVYINKVFYSYKGISPKTLTLKNDTISIASFALENQSSVEKIAIPSAVQYIPGNFVCNCDNLSSFAVDSQNHNYSTNGNAIILTNEKAIAVGCKATEIPTDGSIDKIWEGAFYGCKALTSIEIPENVIEIQEKAFYGSGLTSVNIHKDMQTIKGGAFDNLSSLTEINFNAVNCNSSEGCWNYKDFVGCKKGVVVNIGEDVEVINGGVFSGSDCIRSFNFASDCKVTTLGINAFNGCYNSNFSRFDIPSSVTTLCTGCFANTQTNYGLTWLIIPTTVIIIEKGFASSTSGSKKIFCYITEDDKPIGWDAEWNLSKESTGEYCKVYWNDEWWLNGGTPIPLETST